MAVRADSIQMLVEQNSAKRLRASSVADRRFQDLVVAFSLGATSLVVVFSAMHILQMLTRPTGTAPGVARPWGDSAREVTPHVTPRSRYTLFPLSHRETYHILDSSAVE